MITQTVCLFIAFIVILILILGLAFVGIRCEQMEHRIINLERESDVLKEKIEIHGNHIDHIYNVLISMNGELKSLEKEIHPSDVDVKI